MHNQFHDEKIKSGITIQDYVILLILESFHERIEQLAKKYPFARPFLAEYSKIISLAYQTGEVNGSVYALIPSAFSIYDYDEKPYSTKNPILPVLPQNPFLNLLNKHKYQIAELDYYLLKALILSAEDEDSLQLYIQANLDMASNIAPFDPLVAVFKHLFFDIYTSDTLDDFVRNCENHAHNLTGSLRKCIRIIKLCQHISTCDYMPDNEYRELISLLPAGKIMLYEYIFLLYQKRHLNVEDLISMAMEQNGYEKGLHALLGVIKSDENDFSSALHIFRQALYSSDLNIHCTHSFLFDYNILKSLSRSGQHNKAYLFAMELMNAPDYEDVAEEAYIKILIETMNLYLIYREYDKCTGLIDICNEYVEFTCKKTNMHYYDTLGDYYQALGNIEEAKNCYKKSLSFRFNPDLQRKLALISS